MITFNKRAGERKIALASHRFLQRRLMDTLSLHLIDGVMLFLAVLIGDSLLCLMHGIPVQMAPILLVIPVWWIGSWMVHLVPGWGLGDVEELRRIQILLLLVFGAASVAVFLQRGFWVSRITFFVSYLSAVILVPLGRYVIKRILVKVNLWGVPTAIYGNRETIPVVHDALSKNLELGYVPTVAFCDDNEGEKTIADLTVCGDIETSTRKAVVAVVSLPNVKQAKMSELLEGPLSVYQTILLVPDLKDTPSLLVRPIDMQGILGLEIRRNLLDPVAYFFKEFIERSFVLITLPIWGTISVFSMILVWLQDFSSPIYAQERVGRNNKKINVYKLRSMVPDAEKVLQEELAKNPLLKDEWETHYKLKHDPRITFFGRFLRKTSIDELPQLWCVLIGTMSLVGPRPLPEYHHKELEPRTQRLRIKVRPGVTGLWQVSGRSNSGLGGMNRWDTYYVTNWSGWLDLVIIVRTIRVVIFCFGAY